jgi:hypothetical protein
MSSSLTGGTAGKAFQGLVPVGYNGQPNAALPPWEPAQFPVDPSRYNGMLVEYGAVEPYSGYGTVKQYTLTFTDLGWAEGGASDERPSLKLQMRMRSAAKHNFVARGVSVSVGGANVLSEMRGQPSMPRYSLDHWSMRELNSVVKGLAATEKPAVSLRALLTGLANTPTINPVVLSVHKAVAY